MTGSPSQTFVGVNFSGAVTTTNFSDLNGTSLTYGLYSTNWRDSDQSGRTGTSTQYFNRYNGSNGTIYYAPQNSVTINGVALTANHFYTQSGGGSTTQQQTQTEYPPASENGWMWIRRFTTIYQKLNYNDSYWNENNNHLMIVRNGSIVHSNTYAGTSVMRYPQNTMYKRGALMSTIAGYGSYYEVIEWTSADLGWIRIFYDGAYIYTPAPSYTYADATSSSGQTAVTINGYTYTRGTHVQTYYDGVTQGNNGLSTTENYKIASRSTTVSVSVPVDYTYSAHTRSETQTSYWTYPTQQATATRYSFPSNMTYSVWSDTIPAGTVTPATDAFTYDDARTKIYQRNTSSGTPTVINDESRGNNWLGQGRAFSGADAASAYGYFLKTVRGSNNLPTLSNAEIRATPSGTDVMTGDALHTPQRINFTITDPTDQSGAPDAYRLYRKDNGGTVDLGYIKPSRLNSTAYSTDISFSFNSTNKTITISNLLTASKYRIKWWAYQQSRVGSITVGSGSANTAIAAKSNTTGFSFDGSSSIVIQLATSTSGDARMFACDFWLEESVLAGSDAASLLDDTFAVIKCYDVLHDTAFDSLTNDTVTTVEGTSDFLDLFAADLLNDGLGSSSAVSAPDYCKFFKESNNFFFAVGTEFTTATLYGGSGNTNKKGSYLFVSEYNDPTTWYASGYVQFDSEITGLHTYPGEMIVWTESGTYRVTGSRYDQMRKTKLATTEGMPEGQHRTAVLVNNYLVWMSQSGICIYDGRGVANLTRGRFNDFGFTDAQKRHAKYDLSNAVGTALHAGQYEGIYYLVGSDEAGFAVDFNLEGFPVSRVDLKEGAAENTTTPPVLFYNPRENQLLSRRGRIAEGSGNNTWTYKTREFDGGAFGSLKLVKSVVVNGSGSGKIQIYLDGVAAFTSPGQDVSVDYSPNNSTQPARIYVPASPTNNTYKVPIADVWSVEIINWDGKIDWIDTEYEMVSA